MNLSSKIFTALMSMSATLAVACGDDGGSASGGSSSSDTDDRMPVFTTADDSQGSTGFELVCIPGTQRCGDQVTVETCADNGVEWLPEPCGPNSNCVPCEEVDCTTATCQGPCDVAADLPSSAGCSFIANRNLHFYEDWPDGVVLGNPNDEGTARIELFFIPEGKRDPVPYEAMPVLELAPGEVSAGIPLSTEFLPCCSSFLRTGGIFRIRSNLPIVAYQHAPLQANFGNESSLLLPDEVLGTQYVVSSLSASILGFGTQVYAEPSYFVVVALEDDTTVQWTPRYAALNGTGLPIPPAQIGETVGITMNKYETLRIVPSENGVDKDVDGWNFPLDVSGTVISADQPIWVLGASRGSAVPTESARTGDQLQEVLFPLSLWGDKYVAPAPPQRGTDTEEKSYWRLYAATPGVTITAEPAVTGLPATLDERGEYIDVEVEHGVHTVFEGDGAFLPVEYLRSRLDSSGEPDEPPDIERGDSSMVQMVPVEQFLNRYTFATAVGFAFNYVQVIRTQGGAAVTLDGAMVTGWEPAGADYEVATVLLDTDPEELTSSHDILSSDPFGILQIGWAAGVPGEDPGCIRDTPDTPVTCNSSYAYPGGLKADRIFVP
jgi:hypothetical protein